MIKLRVPNKKILPSFINQGNWEIELKAGGMVTTASRAFADFLITNHGLTEENRKTTPKKKSAPRKMVTNETSAPVEAQKTEENNNGGEE